MEKNTADETASEFIQQLTNKQLFDQYRILELRKRYWKMVVKHINDSYNRQRLLNMELWLAKVWNELVSRIEGINSGLINLLIETESSFSILD
jgi:hypothetical protein